MFDTNALIAFFAKNEALKQYFFPENKIILSIITVLEFLSFKSLTEQEKDLFFEFCGLADVIDISFNNSNLIDLISSIRKNNKLKLPDSIIAASAITSQAILITNDKQFSIGPNLQTLTF